MNLASRIMAAAALILLTTALSIHAVSAADEPVPNTAMTAVDFTTTAAGSDEFERQSGRVAIARAQNPEVRALAELLVTHHAQTTNELNQAATAAGLPPPTPKLHPGLQRKLDHLNTVAQEDFDKWFLQHQAEVHKDAIALMKTYAQVGDVEPLRTVAAKTLPVVQGHLEEVYTLQHTEF
jgi:putative membrane protein